MICEDCGNEITIGSWPFCPDHGKPRNFTITQDEIPGGMVINNLGPEPVKVYSHSERRAIMKARGLREQVRHVGVAGSDKSPHTSRWV